MFELPKLVAAGLISAGIYLIFADKKGKENEHQISVENGDNRPVNLGGSKSSAATQSDHRVISPKPKKAKKDGTQLEIADHDLSGNGGD